MSQQDLVNRALGLLRSLAAKQGMGKDVEAYWSAIDTLALWAGLSTQHYGAIVVGLKEARSIAVDREHLKRYQDALDAFDPVGQRTDPDRYDPIDPDICLCCGHLLVEEVEDSEDKEDTP